MTTTENHNADIIICGAGIAGVATAYYLSQKYQATNIVLIDKQQALSFTTAMSGENYRDYWPQSCLMNLVSHSIELMQELAPEFVLKETGYDFISLEENKDIFPSSYSGDISDYLSKTSGNTEVSQQYPHLSQQVAQVVSVKRAGSFDVYTLGSILLREAKKRGVRFIQDEIDTIEQQDSTFELSFINTPTRRLTANKLVLSGGPFVSELAEKLGLTLPVKNYLQRKFIMPDPKGIIPRDMPFTIFSDDQYLQWSDEERQMIEDLAAEDKSYQYFLEEFPAGLHIKPEGSNQIKLGWAYNRSDSTPLWDVPTDDRFAELVVRGASKFIPALSAYVENMPTPLVHFAGYYTRTEENWPLIGPLAIDNVYVAGALAGYGTMSACAVGELCSDWIMSGDLPDYAKHFSIDRYKDASLIAEMNAHTSDGQL